MLCLEEGAASLLINVYPPANGEGRRLTHSLNRLSVKVGFSKEGKLKGVVNDDAVSH